MKRIRSNLSVALLVLLFCLNASGSHNAADLIVEAKGQEALWTSDSYRRAIELLERAASDARSTNDKRNLHLALVNSARLHNILYEYDRALALAQESARVANGLEGANEQIESLSVLLQIALAGSRTDLATFTARKIEAGLPRITSDHSRWAALQSLGEFSTYHGSAAETVSRFRDALAAGEAGGDHAAITLSCLKLGNALIRIGEPLDARANIERALQLSRSAGDRRLEAQSLFGMGFLLSFIDSKQEAIVHYREAESLYATGFDLIGLARVLNAISTVYEDLGDNAPALQVRRRALANFEKAGYRSGVLATLPSLAVLHFLSGDESQSRRILDRAEALARELDEAFYLGVVKERKGYISFESGQFEQAFEEFGQALNIYNSIGRSLPRVNSQLGNSLARLGKISAARDLIGQALQENLRTRDHLAAAENLLDLAMINRSGDPDVALKQLERSFEIAENINKAITNRRLKSAFATKLHSGYETILSIMLSQIESAASERAEETFALAERSRARSITEILSDSSRFAPEASHSLVGEEARIRTLINAKADRLTFLLSRDSNAEEVKIAEGELVELQALLDEAKMRAADRLPYRQLDIAALRNGLEDGDVLLEYYLGNSQSFLWLVTRNAVSVYALPAAGEIIPKVHSVQEILGARKPLDSETLEQRRQRIFDAEAKYSSAARELSNMILGPVAERIQGKRLIVVPDGKLNYFPISALPMPHSDSDDPILLTNEVIYQPSAQTYALLKKIGQERKDDRAKDLLVFSDPVFNPADERLTGIEIAAEKNEASPYRFRLVESFSSLSRLPASRTEAETVSKAVGGSDLFMGFDATRERLLSTNLADYKVVHLATHGFLDPERPELSSLVFSRYDQTGQQLDESIRMHDIYSMKLNADLVVLSACQTGTGKEVKGEGVMGLNTAFLQAGARSVVSTLWQVEDNAANQLMKEFYGHMAADGMSPSAALRAAQIKLYRDPQFRSPFFWAAFTIHGDAASATPFKRTHTKPVIGISIAVLLGVGFILLRRRYRTSKV